jgi:hypothetical protein
MNKTITIKEHILNYAKSERYFNINDLRNYFNDKKIDYKNDTLTLSMAQAEAGIPQ